MTSISSIILYFVSRRIVLTTLQVLLAAKPENQVYSSIYRILLLCWLLILCAVLIRGSSLLCISYDVHVKVAATDGHSQDHIQSGNVYYQ